MNKDKIYGNVLFSNLAKASDKSVTWFCTASLHAKEGVHVRLGFSDETTAGIGVRRATLLFLNDFATPSWAFVPFFLNAAVFLKKNKRKYEIRCIE